MDDERGPMRVTTAPGEQRVFLGDVRWETFQALLHDLGEHRGRLAYDQGLLEIMSPSYDHESIKGLLGHFVRALADELAIPIRAAGSIACCSSFKPSRQESPSAGNQPTSWLGSDLPESSEEDVSPVESARPWSCGSKRPAHAPDSSDQLPRLLPADPTDGWSPEEAEWTLTTDASPSDCRVLPPCGDAAHDVLRSRHDTRDECRRG